MCVFQEGSLLRSLQPGVLLLSYLMGKMVDVNIFSWKHSSELNGSFEVVIFFVHVDCGVGDDELGLCEGILTSDMIQFSSFPGGQKPFAPDR